MKKKEKLEIVYRVLEKKNVNYETIRIIKIKKIIIILF